MDELQIKLDKLNLFTGAMKNALSNTLDLYAQKEDVEAHMKMGKLDRESGMFELLEIVNEIESSEANLLAVSLKKQELASDVKTKARELSAEDKKALRWYNYKDEADCSMSEILLREWDKNPKFLGE